MRPWSNARGRASPRFSARAFVRADERLERRRRFRGATRRASALASSAASSRRTNYARSSSSRSSSRPAPSTQRTASFASFAWLRVAGSAHDAARGELAQDPLRAALAACPGPPGREVQLEDDEAAIAARAEELARRLATAAILGIIAAPPVASDATPTSPTESPEAKVLADELRRAIEAAVAALAERPRRLVGLYHGEGRTLRDVSTELEAAMRRCGGITTMRSSPSARSVRRLATTLRREGDSSGRAS